MTQSTGNFVEANIYKRYKRWPTTSVNVKGSQGKEKRGSLILQLTCHERIGKGLTSRQAVGPSGYIDPESMSR